MYKTYDDVHVAKVKVVDVEDSHVLRSQSLSLPVRRLVTANFGVVVAIARLGMATTKENDAV